LKMRKDIADLFVSKKFKEAFELLETYKKESEDIFRYHMLRCQAFYDVGKNRPAIEEAKKAIAEHPRSLAAGTLLATIYQTNGLLHDALDVIERSINISPRHMKHVLHQAAILMDNGNYDESIKAYEKVIALNPDSFEAKFGVISNDILMNHKPSYEITFSSLQESKDVAKFCNARAVQLARLGKFMEAEKLYVNSLKILGDLSVDSYKVFMNLGLMCKKANNLKKAVEFFRKSSELAPKGYDRPKEQIEEIRVIVNKRKEQKKKQMMEALKKKA
ncbi:MAG: tetratricopeptide repeat protein, partial [Oligoflexales bacterium]|nr:tetratricopeptide repeat protein [Oligoflexales bacterium]